MSDPEGTPPESQPVPVKDYHQYLRLPLATRQELRAAQPEAIAALEAAHHAKFGIKHPVAPEAAPVPHVTAETFGSYREFLRAPRAARDVYRAAHAATVQMWESEFASATRVKRLLA